MFKIQELKSKFNFYYFVSYFDRRNLALLNKYL